MYFVFRYNKLVAACWRNNYWLQIRHALHLHNPICGSIFPIYKHTLCHASEAPDKFSLQKSFSNRLLLLVLIILLVGACSKNEPKQNKKIEISEDKLLEELKINENSENILYTFMDEYGNFKTVNDSHKIEDPCRNDVIVVPLSLPPEKRLSATKVIVADLDDKRDGFFKLKIEGRAGFETSLQIARKWKISRAKPKIPDFDSQAIQAPLDPTKFTDDIILYMAPWCAYCKKAAAYLRQKGIKFIEKDIEKDNQAALEMQQKCAAAKIECRGVPLIDWTGKLIKGFDKATIDRLIKSKPKSVKPIQIGGAKVP